MVRLHHPDVSPDPESAEKFRKAQEAYNALSKSAAGAAGDGGGDGSHVQYDDDGSVVNNNYRPEKQRIQEMLWREEMIRK